MKPYILIVLLLAGFAPARCQLPGDHISQILKEAVNSKRSKSIIVGIIDSAGRRIYSEGVLSDRNPAKPDANTLYEIGSITKVFTSLILADMSLEGKLSLEDPISKWLPPSVKVPVRNGTEITLLNLSVHTATFPRFPFNTDPKNIDDPYADYNINRLYEYLAAYRADIDFGTRWRYSNTAYGLLGHLLTRAAGEKNYEQLVIDHICNPLKMGSTVISLTPALLKNTAIGHSEWGQPVGFLNLASLDGAGAFRSNVNDLLTFAAANLGWIATDLYPAMKLTHQSQIKKEAGGIDYATMGWTLWQNGGRNIVFKDGGTPGYRTFIGIDKVKKFAVVVLSNSNNGVTDIGTHIIDPGSKINTYQYPWALLDTLRQTLKRQGINETISRYRQLKANSSAHLLLNENQLNNLGIELRRSKKTAAALKIFELNAAEYPNSVVVYESLAETYKINGNRQKAIINFEKARQLDPDNPHWNYVLSRLTR
ncbi:serine hydrolase [Niabella yanshanensis]|uniref:Serine hydrolase n=1 Tax=Niabella yanshanensis TaxID=577386 RepID=A0ABZ0W6W2_9BACT|nr:serine hydrolase domain-containing protein [Niabella yanshanensis]WQD37811.1 serine hydrolase [Niabella yanshanensis]